MGSRHKSLMLKPKQEQSEKPPAAKPLRSNWISYDDPKPRVNTSYKKVPICFSTSGIA